jgi:hypothetical protein
VPGYPARIARLSAITPPADANEPENSSGTAPIPVSRTGSWAVLIQARTSFSPAQSFARHARSSAASPVIVIYAPMSRL